MTPKERVAYIKKKLRNDYISVTSKLTGYDFELIGTRIKPRGIKLRGDDKIINSILRLKSVEKSLSTGLSGKKLNTKIEESYFCFKVIFQIQIEGKTKGFQTYEERFMLVKADNWKKAEVKLIKEFKDREEPYLNSDGQMVRWKFESIEESYHTFINDKSEFDNPVEVFSRLRIRKLKKESIWRGE